MRNLFMVMTLIVSSLAIPSLSFAKDVICGTEDNQLQVIVVDADELPFSRAIYAKYQTINNGRQNSLKTSGITGTGNQSRKVNGKVIYDYDYVTMTIELFAQGGLTSAKLYVHKDGRFEMDLEEQEKLTCEVL